jgi:hypothetical protein
MQNKKGNLMRWISGISLFLFFLFFPVGQRDVAANSLVGATICPQDSTITADDPIPGFTWSSSGADLGACTTEHLPAPETITLAGGSCTQDWRGRSICANGATPAVVCSGGSLRRSCTCSCPSRTIVSNNQNTLVLVGATPASTTTYKVTCSRSDGRGGAYVATACSKVTVKPYMCLPDCSQQGNYCSGVSYFNNCGTRCTGTKTLSYQLSSYSCITPPANCPASKCSQRVSVDSICTATRECQNSFGISQTDTLTPADCEAPGIGVSCPTDALCQGCLLNATGWREVQPRK